MTKTLKLISAAALMAATSTAAFAQDVPLNTTVSGGAGAEQVDGQVGGALVLSLGTTATIVGLTTLLVVAGSTGDTD